MQCTNALLDARYSNCICTANKCIAKTNYIHAWASTQDRIFGAKNNYIHEINKWLCTDWAAEARLYSFRTIHIPLQLFFFGDDLENSINHRQDYNPSQLLSPIRHTRLWLWDKTRTYVSCLMAFHSRYTEVKWNLKNPCPVLRFPAKGQIHYSAGPAQIATCAEAVNYPFPVSPICTQVMHQGEDRRPVQP